jgi:hypothetical protein
VNRWREHGPPKILGEQRRGRQDQNGSGHHGREGEIERYAEDHRIDAVPERDRETYGDEWNQAEEERTQRWFLYGTGSLIIAIRGDHAVRVSGVRIWSER